MPRYLGVRKLGKHWFFRPSNPIKGKLPPAPSTEHSTLELEQLKELMLKLPLREKIIVGLGVFAGLRIGEIFALSWENVDFINNTLYIQQQFSSGILAPVKTESSRSIIPLWGPLATLLKMWQLQFGSQTWLFKVKKKDQPLWPERWRQQQWGKIKVQFNLPKDLRFHDLRHSFATILLSRGADKADVQ